MPATFSVLEIQLSPFLLATFSKKYLQKTLLSATLRVQERLGVLAAPWRKIILPRYFLISVFTP
jgi:hypothetical protein